MVFPVRSEDHGCRSVRDTHRSNGTIANHRAEHQVVQRFPSPSTLSAVAVPAHDLRVPHARASALHASDDVVNGEVVPCQQSVTALLAWAAASFITIPDDSPLLDGERSFVILTLVEREKQPLQQFAVVLVVPSSRPLGGEHSHLSLTE